MLYPNPGTGTFRIYSTSQDEISIEIYDTQGKFIQAIRPVGKGSKEIDLSFLPGGMYLIKVETKESSFTQKLIIE